MGELLAYPRPGDKTKGVPARHAKVGSQLVLLKWDPLQTLDKQPRCQWQVEEDMGQQDPL